MSAFFNRNQLFLVLLLLLAFQACRTPEPVTPPEPEPVDPRPVAVRDAAAQMVAHMYETKLPVELPGGVSVDRVIIDDQEMDIGIYMNDRFSYIPMRPEAASAIYALLADKLPGEYRDYEVTIYALGEPIDNLIPNFYRLTSDAYDFLRMPYADELRPRPVVQRHDRMVIPGRGMEGRQIALWHSHGWHFNQQKDRWEWQRPRLFQTVEDLLPMAFTIPYLIPMLENAGAHVWTPRERDLQTNEVIVDFDNASYDSRVDLEGAWETGEPGFAIGSPPYESGENPFRQGTYRYRETSESSETEGASIHWIPDFPEAGEYAVYISYVSVAASADDAQYSVYHRGGRTDFTINQKIGGGTWIYLGHFEFEEGMDPNSARVELTSGSRKPSVITADAVRFGGGMGNIARNGQTSGRARYLEAARYYLQYAGMPDSLVYNLSQGESDAVDDFQGRGEWVNYLRGAPFGPDKDRESPGLGIPIDLSLAFHTDAGITRNDTVVGTLMIYSIEDIDSQVDFPDKISRLANRDFADIMQTGIVDELRRTWDPAWNRRHLMNRRYSEATRPNVPAVLLELLSHQNFLDMQYANDPRFRFDVSRAIYKSMLRFLADRYQLDYIVQPLPVSHFRLLPVENDGVMLRWSPVSDTLEPSAEPDRYIVYKKRGNEPFDSGRVTSSPEFRFTGLDPGVMYQFKVVAANDGGKSFPSETLAMMVHEDVRRSILIVNGFERISGPAVVDESGFKGFANFLDAGVPDRYDIHFTGEQFDFDPDSEWRTNDAPGHGASYSNYETRIIPGNRFDFPARYGRSLMELGVPFVSASAASIRSRKVDMNDFDAVILILGNQKTTTSPKHDQLGRDPEFQVFPPRLREELDRFLSLGGRLFISGAHVGTDAEMRLEDDPDGIAFIQDRLRFAAETNHAVRTGGVRSASESISTEEFRFSFNTGYHPEIYRVDAPDAIVPFGDPFEFGNGESMALTSGAEQEHDSADDAYRPGPGVWRMPSVRSQINPSGPETVIRYEENHFSAGVGYRSDHHAVITFGFPFETISDPQERTRVLSKVLGYLGIPFTEQE